jgi:serine/threonine-protein kinase
VVAVSEYPPIPGYDLLELRGRNGHLVYLARQSRTGRLVRLNVVNSDGEFGQMVADRLRQQARALAALDHPNIVRLVEIGDAQGHGFFSALYYVDGGSLADMVRRALPDHAEIVRIARSVAIALDYAHGRNIVHGNLHARHILLDRTGHVSLIGFGEIGPECPEGVIFGNPHYMAPERLADFGKIVPQTDVYALAEVVFLLMSGFYPFQHAEDIDQLLNRKRLGPVPSVREYRPDMPLRVDVTLQRAMALRPEDRFRSAGQLVKELVRAFRRGKEEDKKWWQFWR